MRAYVQVDVFVGVRLRVRACRPVDRLHTRIYEPDENRQQNAPRNLSNSCECAQDAQRSDVVCGVVVLR